MKLVFDLETDGLLKTVTRIWCACAIDVDTGTVYKYSPSELQDFFKLLISADTLIAHNSIGFDFQVIKKLHPKLWDKIKDKELIDTLILSRLIYADMGTLHYLFNKKYAGTEYVIPGKLVGNHSIEAWGYLLKLRKGSFGGTTDWSYYTEEMLDYCVLDTQILLKLYKKLMEADYNKQATTLEHECAWAIHEQENHGVLFNTEKANKIASELEARQLEILTTLRENIPDREQITKTPAYYEIMLPNGINFRADTKGALQKLWKQEKILSGIKATDKQLQALVTEGPLKVNKTAFNPNSRKQIINYFCTKYGWKPTKFTEKGGVALDEAVLRPLKYPEVNLLIEYFIIGKTLGFIKTGQKAWLKLVDSETNRIHGRVITNGAVTRRATHSNPNLGQVPSKKSAEGRHPLVKELGGKMRSLFTVPEGYVLVGADADGLELRCLASEMYPYDFGVYVKAVCEGKKEDGMDVHSINMRAIGVDNRDTAKTFIYAWLYGAGSYKIGLTVGIKDKAEAKELYYNHSKLVKAAEKYFAKEALKTNQVYTKMDVAYWIKGTVLKNNFLSKMKALGDLKKNVEKEAASGYITGIDGGKLKVRNAYSALNTSLQSAGAIICKQWLVNVNNEIKARQLDAKQVLWVHDEIQIEVIAHQAEEVAQICRDAMLLVNKQFPNFKCPLKANADIGINWAETH